MSSAALAKLADELTWLQQYPWFEERPATLEEFLGPDYLNIARKVRRRILMELKVIMGEKVDAYRPTAFPYAMITGGIGIGKELQVDEPVLTPKGWVPIGSLMVGDDVIGRSGTPTTVTGVYPQGVKPLYRVTFSDGASVLAGLDHQWLVQHYRRRTGPQTMTTRDLLKRGLKAANGQRAWSIPLVSPVQYQDSGPLPMSPYTYGALLGDGGLTTGIRFSSADPEIIDRLQWDNPAIIFKRINECDWRLVTDRGQPNPLLDAVRSLGMDVRSEHKRIHEVYLRSSVAARLEVLRGLMDTDGWYVEKYNTCQFASASRGLVDDVVELVRSLGGLCSDPKFKLNDGLGSWFTSVKLSACPFWLDRKARGWKPRTSNPIARTIESIEYECDDHAVCISVDAPDHLYVTKDFIVTHNTTVASIVLPYLCHWVLCLKDPQDFYDLLPGTKIAFMQMSTSEKQALEVVFGDIKARIEHSPWFTSKYPFDPSFKNQIRFPQKNLWILPGDSTETSFEGYNILGGILDEADSHKLTPTKDYAEQGFNTIDGRITSRFQDRGFLLVIGQMKSATGFAARKYKEFLTRTDAYAVCLAIWDSMGDDFYEKDENGETKKFYYDVKNRQIIPNGIAVMTGSERFLAIPELYRPQFTGFPEKALKDLAGIPPAVSDPFISLVNKIEAARDRWTKRYGGLASPVGIDGRIANWFTAKDSLPRVAHIDIAYSGDGDALGIAMGHVPEMVDREGERKPYIVIDFLMRMKAPPGGEIFLADMRQVIYSLRGDRNFKLKKVTMDGFQSTDTRQQLERRRFEVEEVSVDKQLLPYHDLREAIYEDRIEFPPYLVDVRRDSGTERVEILIKELSELVDNGKKIDHPVSGSKDVADAVAGVTFTLMGDRRYQRKGVALDQGRQAGIPLQGSAAFSHPAYRGDFGMSAPLPPSPGR